MTLELTPNLGIAWCPTCQPERGLGTEVLETQYCYVHAIDYRGVDDGAVGGAAMLGTGEADGHDCREMAKILKEART